MIISRENGLYCAKVFHDYFNNYNDIEQYMREEKIKSLDQIPTSIFPPEDDLFSDFSMHPNDMDIEVVEIPGQTWETLLSITSSHINKAPVGRNVQLAVREKNSGKILGFIRLGSPVIYMRPRNEMLGQVFSQTTETSKRFNASAMMGFVIVPSQPFGFNYLGGKLMAGICTSHTVREICNKKYGMNLCLFETTSLYGSTKQVSQYDGMKPYIPSSGLRLYVDQYKTASYNSGSAAADWLDLSGYNTGVRPAGVINDAGITGGNPTSTNGANKKASFVTFNGTNQFLKAKT